ncbi:MAG: methyltransferase family protein [Gemmatimonadales bacterium]
MPESSPDAQAYAGVKIPPPLLYLIPLALSWWLERRWPLPLDTGWPAAGWVFVALGLLCMAPAVASFRRAGTAVIPVKPATTLVVTGLYRWTRNPMYAGFTTVYLGGLLLLHSWWTVAFLPLILWAIHVLVIFREERYLESRFGQAYRDYCARVRRWI